MSLPVILECLLKLTEKEGVKNIREAEGCYEKEIDEQWWIAINPHDEKLKCSHGPVVEPFTMYVEFNGWPAGIVTMNGGMFAAGSAANEDAFIDALKRAAEV